MKSWRTVAAAVLATASAFVLAASLAAYAGDFLYERLPSFQVKGVTPQDAATRRAFDYLPMEKFPDYRAGVRLSLEMSPKRTQYAAGEVLHLTYTASSRGYATLIDYAPGARAQLLTRNQPVSPGFTYTFSGEATLPAGTDFARLVLARLPLSHASLQRLMEYPFSHSQQVRYVVAEEWIRFQVVDTAWQRDPFYRHPRLWGRKPASPADYYFAQAFNGAVLARGILFDTSAPIYEEYGLDGPVDYWLLAPGDEIELRFEAGTAALPLPRSYLLLFISSDAPPALTSAFGGEEARLTVEVNGFTVRENYAVGFAYFDDDPSPAVFQLGSHLRYGQNWLRLRVDSASRTAVKLRRVELRSELDELNWLGDDMNYDTFEVR